MSYQHILIASGGAKHSRKAEKRAVDLAKACGSKLTLVSVARNTIPIVAYGGGLDVGMPVMPSVSFEEQKARQHE